MMTVPLASSFSVTARLGGIWLCDLEQENECHRLLQRLRVQGQAQGRPLPESGQRTVWVTLLGLCSPPEGKEILTAEFTSSQVFRESQQLAGLRC